MKTNIFNLKRVGLLFQRYFTERFNTELIYWGIMIIVFMFIRNIVPAITGLILIAGVFYAARFFREIHSRNNGVAYFMIPATQLEKLTVGIIMTSFYYFAMMVIMYVIGNLLGTFLNNIIASINFLGFDLNIFHHSPLNWYLFYNITYPPTVKIGNTSPIPLFLFFSFGQSVYLLGSIYFKSNQFLKTFLTVIVIPFFLLILSVIEILLIIGNDELIKNPSHDFGMMVSNILHYSIYMLIPFFWVVSYFRLTEKQV